MERDPGGGFDSFGFETAFADQLEDRGQAQERISGDVEGEAFLAHPNEGFADHGEDLSWLGELLAAEDEAVRESDAEWLEADYLDTSEEGEDSRETVEAFAARIGKDWSERRGGSPAPGPMRDWLISDHRDTLEGARLRRRNTGKAVTEEYLSAVTRAWMVSRENHMKFQTDRSKGVASLGSFGPPQQKATLVSDALVGGSSDTLHKGKTLPGAKIAPLMLRFARALRERHSSVAMTNYHGHGGGSFYNRGYSLDLWLGPKDEHGFYRRDDALRLFRAIDQAAASVGARWRAIYNDFSVADEINRELMQRHVVFVGGVRRAKDRSVTGLNWHGPDPLILHIHLDIVPRSGAPESEGPRESRNELGYSAGNKEEQMAWQIEGLADETFANFGATEAEQNWATGEGSFASEFEQSTVEDQFDLEASGDDGREFEGTELLLSESEAEAEFEGGPTSAQFALLRAIPDRSDAAKYIPLEYKLDAKAIVGSLPGDLQRLRDPSAKDMVSFGTKVIKFVTGGNPVSLMANLLVGALKNIPAGYLAAAAAIAEDWAARGYSRGVVLGADGRNQAYLIEVFGHDYIPQNNFVAGRKIAATNYAAGLVAGYIQGRSLSKNQKAIFWKDLGRRMGDQTWRGLQARWNAKAWQEWYVDVAALFRRYHL